MKIRQRRGPGSLDDSPVLPLTVNGHVDRLESEGSSATKRRRLKRKKRWNVSQVWTCCFVLSGCSAIVLLFGPQRHQDDGHKPGASDATKTSNRNPSVLVEKHKQQQRKLPHNIHEKFPKSYKSIECSDGTTGYLNDDYCDCADDGRDEPKTSACSNLLIQQQSLICQSAADIRSDGISETIKIYPSRIKDGIKDCMDGSDEHVETVFR